MIKTGKELATACLNVANNYKTLYVMGCFGAPMTAGNKSRYIQENSYNQKSARKQKITAATSDTFGFDCVCLIKGLLWGWDGNASKTYGGAAYCSNGVPDIGADEIINKCVDVSTDFSKIAVGELLWMKGHVGIYIGEGQAVECTPSWKDCVQVTTVRNIKSGTGHKWTKHGKLPYVDYGGYSLAHLQRDVGLVTEGGGLPVLSDTENRVHILVFLAQKRLKTLQSLPWEPDGVFGPLTRQAVEHYQKENGCPVTGKLDAATWGCLLEREVNHG